MWPVRLLDSVPTGILRPRASGVSDRGFELVVDLEGNATLYVPLGASVTVRPSGGTNVRTG